MSKELADIVAIVDMDGFTINKKFFCKELGFLKVGNAAAQSFFFDIGLRWANLTTKDKKLCNYVKKHIHKLPFGVPPGVDALPLKALKDIVTDLYKNACKNRNSAVAYKGGNFEKDLFASLSILAVNLETFGCPKATSIIRDMAWLETCGCHVVPEAYDHCPKVEVEAFGLWLEGQLWVPEQPVKSASRVEDPFKPLFYNDFFENELKKHN